MAFAWFVGIVYNTTIVFATTAVVDGVCYPVAFFKSNVDKVASYIWYIVSFYVVMLVIFVACYGRILLAIRRQASTMAGHSSHGTAASSVPQLNQMQSNVIKTMIFVSTFYAIAWLPISVFYVAVMVDPSVTFLDGRYYASMFIAFFYVCANPFIYATKFQPVREILRRMLPFKKTAVSSAAGDFGGAS